MKHIFNFSQFIYEKSIGYAKPSEDTIENMPRSSGLMKLVDYIKKSSNIISKLFPENSYRIRMMLYRFKGIVDMTSAKGAIFFPSKKTITLFAKVRGLLNKQFPLTTRFIARKKAYNYLELNVSDMKQRTIDIEYTIKYLNGEAKQHGEEIDYSIPGIDMETGKPQIGEAYINPFATQESGVKDVLGADELVKKCRVLLKSGKNGFIWGVPAIGKTEILKSISLNGFDVLCIPLHLSEYPQAEDLAGYRVPDKQSLMTLLLKSDFIPKVEEYSQIDPLRPLLLFLDEFPRAKPGTKAVALKMLADRTVGNTKLPDNVVIIGAGNRIGDDKAESDRMDMMTIAEKTRFVKHYNFVPMLEDFIKWGEELVDSYKTEIKDNKIIKTKQDKFAIDQVGKPSINLTTAGATKIHPYFIRFMKFRGSKLSANEIAKKDWNPDKADILYAVDTNPKVMRKNTPRDWEGLTDYTYAYLIDLGLDPIDGILKLDESQLDDIVDNLVETTAKDLKDFIDLIKIVDVDKIKKVIEDSSFNENFITEQQFNSRLTALGIKSSEFGYNYETFKQKIAKLLYSFVDGKDTKATEKAFNISVYLLSNNIESVEENYLYEANMNADVIQSLINTMEASNPQILQDPNYEFLKLVLLKRKLSNDDYVNSMLTNYIKVTKKSDKSTTTETSGNKEVDEKLLQIVLKILEFKYESTSLKTIEGFAKEAIALDATDETNFVNIIETAQRYNIINESDSKYALGQKDDGSFVTSVVTLTKVYMDNFNSIIKGNYKVLYDKLYGNLKGDDYYYDTKLISDNFNRNKDKAEEEKRLPEFMRGFMKENFTPLFNKLLV